MTGGQTQFAEELRQYRGLRRVKTPDLPCAGLAVRSMLQAAKFLYSSESSARPDEGEKACESKSNCLSCVPCGLHSFSAFP